jgi:CheY-like chemotaxis protein
MRAPLKGKSILIVDDEPDLREILREEFQALGAEIFEAGSGASGFQTAERHRPDFILTDLKMPEGGGRNLIQRVNAIDPKYNPHVFLVTGHNGYSETEIRDMGFEGVIMKPFNLAQVCEALVSYT